MIIAKSIPVFKSGDRCQNPNFQKYLKNIQHKAKGVCGGRRILTLLTVAYNGQQDIYKLLLS